MFNPLTLELRFPSTSKIIVGVSGGADSVALLDVLHRTGFECVVAHCNFHLRGAEADRDEAYVRTLAERLSLPFRKVDFDTVSYAKLRSISIEMAARELRYNWFHQLRLRENAVAVAVAHHADDVLETFLLNLSRGTGLRGLSGIREWNGEVWRPLLGVYRKEIEAYLKERSLSYVDDSTNFENVYMRNKFRNEVIPLLQTVNSVWKECALKTIEHLRMADEYLSFHLKKDAEALLLDDEKGKLIQLSDLKNFGNAMPCLLFGLLSPYGFSAATLEDLRQSIEGKTSGKRFYSKDGCYRIEKERGFLLITDSRMEEPSDFEVNDLSELSSLPISISAEVISRSDLSSFERKSSVCYLDMSKLTFPLTFRHWREGDWFIPFGMRGRKKLSDFFTDMKLTGRQKRSCWLLTSSEQIVWVVGIRSDNRFRVDESTKQVCVLRVMG